MGSSIASSTKSFSYGLVISSIFLSVSKPSVIVDNPENYWL